MGQLTALNRFEISVLVSKMFGGGAEFMPDGLVLQHGEVIGRISLPAMKVDLCSPTIREEILRRASQSEVGVVAWREKVVF